MGRKHHGGIQHMAPYTYSQGVMGDTGAVRVTWGTWQCVWTPENPREGQGRVEMAEMGESSLYWQAGHGGSFAIR